jgi:hypothetical protein
MIWASIVFNQNAMHDSWSMDRVIYHYNGNDSQDEHIDSCIYEKTSVNFPLS